MILIQQEVLWLFQQSDINPAGGTVTLPAEWYQSSRRYCDFPSRDQSDVSRNHHPHQVMTACVNPYPCWSKLLQIFIHPLHDTWVESAGRLHHEFWTPNAQVSLSRIYSWMGTNWLFLFDPGIVPGHFGKFLWIWIVYFSSVVLQQASTKVLNMFTTYILSCSQCEYFLFLVMCIENV